jgi:hypothetical protein
MESMFPFYLFLVEHGVEHGTHLVLLSGWWLMPDMGVNKIGCQ